MNDEKEMLTTTELAERWSLSEITLKKWRQKSIGPKYVKLGGRNVLYRIQDVIQYEKQNLVKTGT